MSVIKNLILTGVFCAVHLSSLAFCAEGSNFSVKLKSIEKIHTQEKSGDELHISVTEFPKGGVPSNYQIPTFPSHWLSSYLYNLKDLTIWDKNLQSCTDTKIIFSLVEEDSTVWNSDDLLGSVALDLKCEKGKMISTWSIPNSTITEEVGKNTEKFKFKGGKAEYQLNFKLERK